GHDPVWPLSRSARSPPSRPARRSRPCQCPGKACAAGLVARLGPTGCGLPAPAANAPPPRPPGPVRAPDRRPARAPRPARGPFTATMFGQAGGPPRAVPSDAVLAAASRVVQADIAQKLVLLSIFVLA